MKMKRTLLILVLAILVIGFTPLAVRSSPPPIPMTVYGTVFIQRPGGLATAPGGLYVYAEFSNTTKISNATTDSDGSYALAVTGPPDGTSFDVWVQSVNITRLTLQYYGVLPLNLTVTDVEPPTITPISPTSGATVTSPVWINATLSDNLALDTTTLTLALNTTIITPTYNPATGLLYYQTGTLTSGLYTINITVMDLAQNLATRTWNFTIASTLPNLQLKRVSGWYWVSDTTITSVAAGDVDGDGSVEIVTGGYYYDGTRDVAQLSVWNGSTLALKQVLGWYWVGNTTINSVAIGDVDGDSHMEIVTGGWYYNGVNKIALLHVWNGTTLALKNVKVWSWVGDTCINSVAAGDVDGDGSVEIVTGGYYYDGTRDVAQLTVWTITSG
jgi:hypothetical protein